MFCFRQWALNGHRRRCSFGVAIITQRGKARIRNGLSSVMDVFSVHHRSTTGMMAIRLCDDFIPGFYDSFFKQSIPTGQLNGNLHLFFIQPKRDMRLNADVISTAVSDCAGGPRIPCAHKKETSIKKIFSALYTKISYKYGNIGFFLIYFKKIFRII